MAEIGEGHAGMLADGAPSAYLGIGVDSNVTPEAPVSTKDFVSTMTYVITEPCIGVKDASCVDVCPVDCIHATEDDAMYFIDPDECIDCGACEPECPVTAIFAEDAVPDDQQKYIQINADYFKQ
jgi:NAD-dependent dihydropyrimidine dehydrogenase PreA subunit